MNKKILVGSLGAIAALAAVYLGGVFYTGQKLEQYGADLGKHIVNYAVSSGNLKAAEIFKQVFAKNSLGYVKDSGSLFSENGKVVFKTEDDKLISLPVTIGKGFGSLHFDFDFASVEKNFETDREIMSDLPDLDYDTLKGIAYFKISFILSRSEFKVDYGVKYKDRNLEDFALKIDASSSKDGTASEVLVRNFFANDFAMGSYRLTSSPDKNSKNTLMPGPVTIEIKDLWNGEQQAVGAFKAEFWGTDPDALGNFGLKAKASASDVLSGMVSGIDCNFTLSSFNAKALQEYYTSSFESDAIAQSQALVAMLRPYLNHFELEQLEFSIPRKSAAMLLGTRISSDLKIKAKGALNFDLADYSKVNGSFDVKSNSLRGLETLFTEKNGEYVSKVELVKGRLLVNGHYF